MAPVSVSPPLSELLRGRPVSRRIVLPLARCDATRERTAAGFRISVQLVARYGDEATLFRLSAQLEWARPWFDRSHRSLGDRLDPYLTRPTACPPSHATM
jgi:hypothetical protein